MPERQLPVASSSCCSLCFTPHFPSTPKSAKCGSPQSTLPVPRSCYSRWCFVGAAHSGVLADCGRQLYTQFQCSDRGPATGSMTRPSHGAAHTRKPRRHGRACVPSSSHDGHPVLPGTASDRRQSGCGRAAPSCPGGPCGNLSVG